jgi:lantibiotic modifying enzyme
MSYKQEWEEIFPESLSAPKIIKIEMDLMDCYPKGRAVAIIHFSNHKKWVFKPRDSALDAAFQEFLGWFNSKNIFKPFKLINIIVKKNHSWSEFVEYSYIEGNDELLFQKYGALLCFFYLFNSTDMHQRNLIISGDTPILIDLETLIQPYNNNNFSWSMFRTNFLPTRPIRYQPDADDIDYALQKGYEQDNKVWSKQKKICWENEGMDNMKIFQRRQLVEPHKWQMGAVKHNMNSLAQVNQVIDAFRKTYLFIIENKNEFLHIITCFKSLKSRIIIRSTKKYDALLNEMSHPLILESQTVLDEFLKPLEYESDYSDNAFRIIEEEKKKLNEMTSPSFYALTDSSGLYTLDNMLIDDYFDYCAMTLISKNVSEMSKEDLKKLIRIIKRHFSYLNYT